MHRNRHLIDMCIMEGCTVLDDRCTECGTPDDWLSDLWPDLLIVGYSHYSWRVEALLVEVKTETGKLSTGQQRFFDEFPDGGPLILARCTEDVLAWYGVINVEPRPEGTR